MKGWNKVFALACACVVFLIATPPGGSLQAQERHIDFASLPLDHAIKTVQGAGRRSIVVFEDPYCPFCQRLESRLHVIDDLTVYVFLFPILTPQSKTTADAIWCSPDRSTAWRDWMMRGQAPSPVHHCDDSPVAANLAMAARLGIRLTPTIVFSDGDLVTGALPLDDLRNMLDGARP